MEEWRKDTKEYVGKVRKQKSKLVKAVKPHSFTAESAITFTSYSIDAVLVEAE